ncbi:MAG: AmmeMemoRadiSam system protein A [Oscillospiraceae bacterium]|nr:AmmeMemoRadiSam system protein A [Oscillospiraceae bacterium]
MSIKAGFLVPHPPVIIPEIGKGRETALAKTERQYNVVARRIAAIAPETVVLITPHSTVYSDYIHISPGKKAGGSLNSFGAGQQFETVYDGAFAKKLEELCVSARIPAGLAGESRPDLDHGVMIPLYFFGRFFGGFRLVRVSPAGLSREDHYRFGALIAEASRELGRKTVVVASGDLSHRLSLEGPYGYSPEGPAFDREVCGIIASGDFSGLFELDEGLCDSAAECALLPLVMLAGALDGKELRCGLLSYEAPLGVGYAVAAFENTGDNPKRRFLEQRMSASRSLLQRLRENEDDYVRLAREALESQVRTGSPSPPHNILADELSRGQAGVFVTIKRHGQLRGCIGTISPAHPSLAEEIRANAVSAGISDPRFSPVTEEELPELVYTVDVLFSPEPATPEELDPARYGIIVSSDRKRGLLLPGLENIDTVKEQLAIAINKAGIPEGKPYRLERFEVVRHK